MFSPRRVSLLAGAALLFLGSEGCGARSSLVDPPADEAAPTPRSPADAGRASFDCSRGVPGRPMLVARVEASIHFAYRDRSSREVFRFTIPSGGYIARAEVIAPGDRVVAFALLRPLGQAPGTPSPFTPRIELVVLDVQGSVLQRRDLPFGENSSGPSYRLVGNANGLAVLTARETSARLGTHVRRSRVERGRQVPCLFQERRDPLRCSRGPTRSTIWA